MATSKRHWRKWLLGVGLSGMLAAGIALFIARYDSRELMKRATLVADLHDWDIDLPTEQKDSGAGSYYWLNNQEILSLRGLRLHSQQMGAAQQGGTVTFQLTFTGQAHCVLFTVNTQREVPLAALNRLLQGNRKQAGNIEELYRSPDGKWILWKGEGRIEGATIQGKSHFRCGMSGEDGDGDLFWLDNSRWITAVQNAGFTKNLAIQTAAVDKPQKFTRENVAPDSPLANPWASSIALALPDRLYVDTFHLSSNPPYRPTSATLYECDLHKGLRTLQKHVARMPSGCAIDDFWLAPQGNRIAWKLDEERLPPFIAWAHRILPTIHVSPQRCIGLWVSDLDGKQMKEIGWVDAPKSPNLKREPYEIKWLPDGKALSFQYQDKLYRVPAE